MTATPTTLSDLMRPILVDPWDDGARLVYADWLDEDGESERAEFIRNQCGPKRSLIATAEVSPKGTWYLHGRNGDKLLAESLERELSPIIAPAGTSVTYRRGFPSAVACTLSAFMGGECERCEGQGERFQPVGTVTSEPFRGGVLSTIQSCPDCKGTGRIPGLADTICGRWPVTFMQIVGHEPVLIEPQSDDEFAGRWIWWGGGEHTWDSNHDVPLCLFPKEVKGDVWNFPERESALRALSDACVDFARERAGLPKLKRN